jgi:aminoglycoside 3-N-acetyltransferase I
MDHAYKQITASDLPVMKELLAVFGEAFGERETYQGNVPSDDYLRALLDKPTFLAVAARSGGAVVGGLATYVLEKFEQARSEVYMRTFTTSTFRWFPLGNERAAFIGFRGGHRDCS